MSTTKKPWTNANGTTVPKNLTVLDIRTGVDKNGKSYAKVQFNKSVELYYQGTKLNLGQYNNMFLKNRTEIEEGYEKLVKGDYMTPEQADKKLDFLNEKNITAEAVLRTTT